MYESIKAYVSDIESDLLKYCLKKKGARWANRFFANKEVMELYNEITGLGIAKAIDVMNHPEETLDEN